MPAPQWGLTPNLLLPFCPDLPAVFSNLLDLFYWPSQPGPPNLSLVPRMVFKRLPFHFGSAGVGAWDREHGWKQLC